MTLRVAGIGLVAALIHRTPKQPALLIVAANRGDGLAPRRRRRVILGEGSLSRLSLFLIFQFFAKKTISRIRYTCSTVQHYYILQCATLLRVTNHILYVYCTVYTYCILGLEKAFFSILRYKLIKHPYYMIYSRN